MLTVYAIQNADGQWLRSKGYGGCGPSWVDDISLARLYQRIGTARGRVGYYVGAYPDLPPPKLFAFTCNEGVELDESARVAKVAKHKSTQKKRKELADAKRKLKDANDRFAKAKKDLEALKCTPSE